jgi:hypothetical protein
VTRLPSLLYPPQHVWVCVRAGERGGETDRERERERERDREGVRKGEDSKGEQLSVSFAAGYIASLCDMVSHP